MAYPFLRINHCRIDVHIATKTGCFCLEHAGPQVLDRTIGCSVHNSAMHILKRNVYRVKVPG